MTISCDHKSIGVAKCPICNHILYTNLWYEEVGLVETIEECRQGCCQYKKHWYYGMQDLRIGKWERSFHCYSSISKKDTEKAEKYFTEFHKRIPRLRKYYKRIGKFRR